MDKEKRIRKFLNIFFVKQKNSYFYYIFYIFDKLHKYENKYFRIKLYMGMYIRSTDGFALEQQNIKEEKLRKIIRLSDFPWFEYIHSAIGSCTVLCISF